MVQPQTCSLCLLKVEQTASLHVANRASAKCSWVKGKGLEVNQSVAQATYLDACAL